MGIRFSEIKNREIGSERSTDNYAAEAQRRVEEHRRFAEKIFGQEEFTPEEMEVINEFVEQDEPDGSDDRREGHHWYDDLDPEEEKEQDVSDDNSDRTDSTDGQNVSDVTDSTEDLDDL